MGNVYLILTQIWVNITHKCECALLQNMSFIYPYLRKVYANLNKIYPYFRKIGKLTLACMVQT